MTTTIRKRNPFDALAAFNPTDLAARAELAELLGPEVEPERAAADALIVLRQLAEGARAVRIAGYHFATLTAPHFNERGIGAHIRFEDGRARTVRYLTDLIALDRYFAVTISDAAEYGEIDPADVEAIAA